jgi:hypothetical protein
MAKVIKGNFPAMQKKMGKPPTKKTPAAAYQLKISLLYCAPLIWRRIQVPGSMTLSRFHDVIQLCMGWTDSHLHQFMIGIRSYGPANVGDHWGAVKDLDESKFTLNELESDIRQRCMYIYDFGDSWEHEIRIESIAAPGEKPLKHPVLLAGEHACPPEDIGGPPGFETFLDAMSAPGNENYDEMRDWYGSDFDPDFFEIDKINKVLRKIK